jgi:FtsP/CotA-like multicopper oxidase with cupredoxin domain
MINKRVSDRRGFFRTVAGVVAGTAGGAVLTQSLGSQTQSAPAAKAAAPAVRLGNVRSYEELNRLYSMESRDGKLDVTLTCLYSYHTINGDSVHLRTYNGAPVGPVISVRPGDTLNIRLINDLPKSGATACPDTDHQGMNNAPVGVDTTNLHAHGFHVSPSGHSDNVFVQVCPEGGCFDYKYEIPASHPTGTMWYHPHKHGSAAVQVANGMAGALIVRGPIDDFYASKGIAEEILLFQQIPFSKKPNGQYTSEWADVNGASEPLTLINGQLKPAIRLDAGKVYLWRMIHGGISETIPFSILNTAGVSQPYYRVAVDGLTTGTVDKMTAVDLAPGYRNDILVKLAAGTYQVMKPAVPRARALNQKLTETAQVLATIIVAQGSADDPIPTAADFQPFVPHLPSFDSGLPVRPIQLGFADSPDGSGHWHFCAKNEAGAVICEPYNPDDPVLTVLGTSEQWQVVNTDSYLAHPFHIHVNPFKVERIEYDDAWVQFYGDRKNKRYNPITRVPIDPREFVWRDTILLHPCQKVIFNTKFEDFDGCFVMHCHILKHEDQGMMKQVEILPRQGATPNCGPTPTGCAPLK